MILGLKMIACGLMILATLYLYVMNSIGWDVDKIEFLPFEWPLERLWFVQFLAKSGVVLIFCGASVCALGG